MFEYFIVRAESNLRRHKLNKTTTQPQQPTVHFMTWPVGFQWWKA